MSYIINLTNGNVFATIQDGTTNTASGLTLIGRNYTSYGQVQNDNFVHLLENFADYEPPSLSSLALTPLTGTLWYDTVGQRIRVYDGANWNMVSERIVSNTTPTSFSYTIKVGDQWYDTVNQQLNSWNGTSWVLVGPSYTASQGKSGPVVESITDTTGKIHTVVSNYTNGNIVSITSFDANYVPVSNTFFSNNFSYISPGINLLSNVQLIGTATNSNMLGNATPSQYARTYRDTTFGNNVIVNGNITLGYGNIHFTSNNNLVLHNHAYTGNVDIYVNTPYGNTNSLHVDGSTGLATVYGNATSNFGVATKIYVDASVGAQTQVVQNIANQFFSNIEALQAEYLANVSVINGAIASLQSNTNANLNSVHSLIDGNVTSLTANVNTYESYANAQSASVSANIGAFYTYSNAKFATLATINSPSLTGTPTAPNVSLLNTYLTTHPTLSFNAIGDFSNSIATTAYVDSTANVLWQDYTTRITNANVNVLGSVNSLLTLKANLAAPVLTLDGNGAYPQSVTPNGGDNSSKIATTAFVANVGSYVAGLIPVNTISPNQPSGGNNGDFWFQIVG